MASYAVTQSPNSLNRLNQLYGGGWDATVIFRIKFGKKRCHVQLSISA